MGSKKKTAGNKNQMNRASHRNSCKIQNALSAAFLVYMFSVYLFAMHDKYFDITITKYKTFAVGLCVYAVLMALAVLVDVLGRIDESRKTEKKKLRFILPDAFMAGFVAVNFIAFLIAADKILAYTGEDGRRCGFQFVLLVMFMYMCLGRRYKVYGFELPVFMLTGSIASIIAILQYIGVDFLGLSEELSDSVKGIYISTLGNIDIFASFLCVLVPVAMGMLLCDIPDTKNQWRRLTAGVTVTIGTAAVVITNADLAYAGVGAAVIVLVLAAFYMGRLDQMVDVFLFVSAGLLLIDIVLLASGKGFEGIDGFGTIAGNTTLLFVVLLVLIIIKVLLVTKLRGLLSAVRGGKALAVAAAVCLCALVCAVAYMKHIGSTVLEYGDSWGSYRGFVWNRLFAIYKDFPAYKILFGNGNETVKALMTESYYDEMIDTVGVVYDNAHNEYLQYLVTTGIFGAVTYIGLILSSIGAALRHQTEICRSVVHSGGGQVTDTTHGMCMALALGTTGYAAQACFNLNQSLTTPYMFLMIALAAGVCRREK